MKTVTIEVETLLKHLMANRAKHIIDFNESLETYRELLIIKLREMLESAEAKADTAHSVSITRPVSYETEYDDIIAKLKWTTETHVTLDSAEFKTFVQDQWRWKNDFSTMAAGYASLKGGLAAGAR